MGALNSQGLMAPDEPPLVPPQPPLPDLGSSSLRANDFAPGPVTPLPTPLTGTPDGAATPGSLGTTARPARRVQWNEEVSAHVSVPFFSESAADVPSPNMSREGGTKKRRKSLSLAEKGGVDDKADPFHDRYRLDDVPVSLIGGEADGAIEGIVETVVKKLDVWVDPLERDGLPCLPSTSAEAGTKDAAAESEQKAKGIVGQYTTGATGLWEGLRRRRASISRMRRFEEDVLDGKASPTSPRDLGTSDDESQPSSPNVPSAPQANAGILAALIALSQQEAVEGAGSVPGSASSSAIPTPLSSGPPSPTLTPTSGYDYDSSDDEYERERFIARLRAKRASKNALHAASTSVASASKHAAGMALRLATGGAFRHDRGRQSGGTSGRSTRPPSEERSVSHSRASSPTASSPAFSPLRRPLSVSSTSAISALDIPAPASPTLAAHKRSRSANSLVQLASSDSRPSHSGSTKPPHRSQSSNTLSRLLSSTSISRLSHNSSPPLSPSSPTLPVGVAVPHRSKLNSELSKRVRRLGDRLGLELETERTRPKAARSEAGVFGGLVLGAVRLTPLETRSDNTDSLQCRPRSSRLPLPPAQPSLLYRPDQATTCRATPHQTSTAPLAPLPRHPVHRLPLVHSRPRLRRARLRRSSGRPSRVARA